MIYDSDLAKESDIRAAILDIPTPELPREPKGADYWTAYFMAFPSHEPQPLPLRKVTVWRYADGRYREIKRPAGKRAWYDRECIRCRWLIVPLQHLAQKRRSRQLTRPATPKRTQNHNSLYQAENHLSRWEEGQIRWRMR